MSQFPPEVTAFIEALVRIGGIYDIAVQKWYLPDIPVEHRPLPALAALPLGMLSRPSGVSNHEVLVSFLFRLTPSEGGWRALEFLSWWVYKKAREGKALQLRSVSVAPPLSRDGNSDQSLTFVIETFANIEDENIRTLMQLVEQLAADLSRSVAKYLAMTGSDAS